MKSVKFALAFFLAALCYCHTGAAQEDFQSLRNQFNDLVKSEKLDDAQELLSKFIDQNPSELRAIGLRRLLAVNFLQAGQSDAAFAQVEKQIEQTMVGADSAVNASAGEELINSVMMIYRRAGKEEEIEPAIDRVIAWVKKDLDGDDFSPQRATVSQLLLMKAQNFNLSGQAEKARDLLKQEFEIASQWFAENPEKEQAEHRLNVISFLFRTADEEERMKLYDTAMEMVEDQVRTDPDRYALLSTAAMLTSTRASIQMQADPDAAESTLNSFKALVEELTDENEEAQRALSRPMASLAGIERRIESTRKLQMLVGQPAPAFDPQFWVGTTNFNPEELEGKVILLDFWAVWCGPCIATFPHLKHWQEAYGDDGLQVVGVTRQYNYTWNDESQRATRSEDKVSAEDEGEMLEKFIAHHELKHPSMVTPEGSEMWSEFGVSGIPHAVVIDRKGVVRLIKVGSGDANARALEEMIKQCLAEE